MINYMRILDNLVVVEDPEYGTTYYCNDGKRYFMFEPREGYIASTEFEYEPEKHHKEDGFVWREREFVDEVLEGFGLSNGQINKMVKNLFKEKYGLTVKTGINFGPPMNE